MSDHVMSWRWGPLLLNPLRKLRENPQIILEDLVSLGNKILDFGSAMGFFTLKLSEMVGITGEVYAADIQPEMLSGLMKRSEKNGYSNIFPVQVTETWPELEDFKDQFDLILAVHVVHECPHQKLLFQKFKSCLNQGGKLLFMEPENHVSEEEFYRSLDWALDAGFTIIEPPTEKNNKRALLM